MAEQVSMRRMMMVLLVAAALSLGACASKKPKFVRRPRRRMPPTPARRAPAPMVPTPAVRDEEAAGRRRECWRSALVYFDFDSSEIKGQGTDVVAAHAKYLASHGSARVRLEGHTDERGSREYNIGLGERRAQAVRRALLLQGAPRRRSPPSATARSARPCPVTTRRPGPRTAASRSCT